MTKIHDPILQCMWHLPCQQSDNVLWCTKQSLWWWRTKKKDVQKIQHFVLKYGDFVNDQPNDNGPNAKLKSLYNVANSVWMLKYGMTKFHLATWNLSWLKHGETSICQLVTSSGTALINKKNPQTSQLNNKYPGMCCLHPSIFWSQDWINKQYITPSSCAYWVTSPQDWW